jgi:hypothetical protein
MIHHRNIFNKYEASSISQAFGLAVVFEREIGYINIREIVANGAELDLHFTPATLSECVDGRALDVSAD